MRRNFILENTSAKRVFNKGWWKDVDLFENRIICYDVIIFYIICLKILYFIKSQQIQSHKTLSIHFLFHSQLIGKPDVFSEATLANLYFPPQLPVASLGKIPVRQITLKVNTKL